MAECPKCGHVYKDPGRVKGGKNSRRTLEPEDARQMVKTREQKRKATIEKNEG